MEAVMPTPPQGECASLKVGLCQVYTEEWAVAANVERTLEAIDEAARLGAEIAVTPECVFHGYASNQAPDYRARMLAAAEPLTGSNLQRVRDRARALGIYVLVGFAERGEGDRVHNTAALLSPTGDLVNVYRKVHCRPFEDISHDGAFTPGDTFSVNRLRFGERAFAVGTMICFDREIPESVRCLRALGAEIVLCPLATDTARLSEPQNGADNEMITRCRAAENEVFIVVVNHAGRFNGGSFVVGPLGECLHQMGAEAGVHVVDVPVGRVASEFHCDPLGWMGWGYRRSDVYRKYLP